MLSLAMYFAFQFQRVALFVSVRQGLRFIGKRLYLIRQRLFVLYSSIFCVSAGVGDGKRLVSDQSCFVRGLGKGFY